MIMSKHVRSVPIIISAVALAAVAAGCSSSASSGSSKSSSSSGTSGTSSSAAVNTGTATVSGKSETVLVAAKDGKTLYYFTPDDASGKATCSGSCASLWPPVLGMPTAGSGVTGMLTAVMGANGSQATYNGHPLYEYSVDTAAGQANGEGVMGKWHAATQSLAATGTTSPAPSTGGSSGGSSGGGSY